MTTTTARRSRDPRSTFAIVCLVAGGLLMLFAGLAHADPVAPAAVPLTILDLPWQAWVAIVLGAFAGVRAIVNTLLEFFKAAAPLTKTLVDDHIRDSLQGLHDKLGKLAGTVNVLVDASKPPGAVPVLSISKPSSGTDRKSVV